MVNKEKILITGGAGYIGSHIVEELIKSNKNVFVIDNLSTGHKKLVNRKAYFFLCDINNIKKVQNIIKKNKITSIIHLAACLSVGESQRNPNKYKKNNVVGTKNLVNIAIKCKIKNFIFSSTCAVYKDKLKVVKENSTLYPKSNYGKTKLSGEKIISNSLKKNKINFAILRFFNVAGASDSGKIGQISLGDQLFKNLSLASVKSKPKIKIYGSDYDTYDGTCIRDYIHVSDISKIHIEVLKKIKNKKRSVILNCGYGKGISVLEAVHAFQKQIKRKIKIEYKDRRKGDMEKIIANNSKIKKFIKWSPAKNRLVKIVKSCIRWEKTR